MGWRAARCRCRGLGTDGAVPFTALPAVGNVFRQMLWKTLVFRALYP